jgi:hypothetical protein
MVTPPAGAPNEPTLLYGFLPNGGIVTVMPDKLNPTGLIVGHPNGAIVADNAASRIDTLPGLLAPYHPSGCVNCANCPNDCAPNCIRHCHDDCCCTDHRIHSVDAGLDAFTNKKPVLASNSRSLLEKSSVRDGVPKTPSRVSAGIPSGYLPSGYMPSGIVNEYDKSRSAPTGRLPSGRTPSGRVPVDRGLPTSGMPELRPTGDIPPIAEMRSLSLCKGV